MNDASKVIIPSIREVKKRRNVESMIGSRFGRWVVKKYLWHHADGHAQFLCRCDCGNEHIVFGYSLTRGQSVSCGCFSKESIARRKTTHGETRGRIQSAEHYTWRSMIQRCENLRHVSYKHYGGRGIRVCDKWRVSFSAFLSDVGRRPSPLHSIGRINNSGNYEPGNVVWQDRIAQANNKRTTKLYTLNGETLSISQWARRFGIHKSKLRDRLVRGCWCIEKAVSTA